MAIRVAMEELRGASSAMRPALVTREPMDHNDVCGRLAARSGRMTMHASGVVAAAMILAVSNAYAQAPPRIAPCAPAQHAQSEVVGVIRQMFVAARADDLVALVAITTPDFYAYDGGKRFTAQTLMELIKKAHVAGKHYEWNVTDPEVHIACNFAWVTYVNRGSIEDAAGHQDMTWLESVILEYAHGQWRSRFLHSTRAPSAQ